MNRKALERAARRLTGQPWSLRPGNGSPIDSLAERLNVSPGEIRRWHQRNRVAPPSAVVRINQLLDELPKQESYMQSSPENHGGNTHVSGNAHVSGTHASGLESPLRPHLTPRNGSPGVDVEEEKTFNSNDDAVRLYLIDQALTHLTRHHGVLGLGANAVQESLREERAQIVGRLQALGGPMMER